MRNKRHDAILSLIKEQNIETQQDLTVALSSLGFKVTQATVSRDIKELRLVKHQNSSGRYVYAQNASMEHADISDKMSLILSKSVIRVDCAINTIVIKTLSGMAQGAAFALDSMHFPECLGSIAGDDTVFVITKSQESAEELCRKIENLTK